MTDTINKILAAAARRVELRARREGRFELADAARQVADALEHTDEQLLGCEYPTYHGMVGGEK